MKKIYLYTPDKEKKAAIERICAEQQIEVCPLKPSDLNRTVADICNVTMAGNGTHKAAPALYAMPELLLFYGIDDRGLDRFLDAYHAAGIEKIRRKAIVTPTNLGWSLYELAEQLEIESSGGKERGR